MPPPQSRRMTLGVVNMNSQVSIGGGTRAETPNKASKQKPPRGRVSMLPRVGRENIVPPSPARSVVSAATANSRRRSVGGVDHRRASSAAVKQDPRPITDKLHQNGCVKRLLEYLITTGYDYPISQKTLARPSGKDFANIVTFLLRKVDPTFQNGLMKFEDEVAMNFKAMGYPFPVSKTALVAAGSPHTWPTLLAALTWLMEHIMCIEADLDEDVKEDPDKPFESLDELEGKTDKAFFRFLSGAYSAFLKGDQQQSDMLTDGLLEMFEHDNMIIEREIDRVTDLNAAILQKMNHLSQESESLPTLSQKREEYATDLEQYHDLVRQMDEHKLALEEKVKERTAELRETEVHLESMTEKVTTLKDTIQRQDLSVEDIRKMQVENERVSEALEKACLLRQNNKEALWISETELNKLFERLEIAVESYNVKITELSLLIDNAGEFKMSINRESAASGDQSQLLQVSLRTDVRPFLADFKAEISEQMTVLRRDLQEELDQLETREAALTEASDILQILEDRKAKCEENIVKEREQAEAALAVRLREIDVLEDNIESLRDPAALEEQIARYQRQCTQLEALQMKHQEENISQKIAVLDEIKTAIRAITDHNQYLQEQFGVMKQYAISKRSVILDVTLSEKTNIGKQ